MIEARVPRDTPKTADVIVIGGGPAGLTAAIYLSRFHLNTLVLDAGDSRAGLIPCTRNHAGYPDGITGFDLLGRMRRQAEAYGTVFRQATVTAIERDGDGFTVVADEAARGKAVLLATGVTNNRPPMDDALHARALQAGLLRYCPICDGYEVTDTRVGVLGTGTRGYKEAVFLRSYTADVTLIAPDGRHDLDDAQRARLAASNIRLVETSTPRFTLEENTISVITDTDVLAFNSLYPALGSVVHSGLAGSLGAKLENTNCVIVDSHQRTTVPGLYAAGDVVLGIDQISHAMGEGGVAATTIRNDLAEREPLDRK